LTPVLGHDRQQSPQPSPSPEPEPACQPRRCASVSGHGIDAPGAGAALRDAGGRQRPGSIPVLSRGGGNRVQADGNRENQHRLSFIALIPAAAKKWQHPAGLVAAGAISRFRWCHFIGTAAISGRDGAIFQARFGTAAAILVPFLAAVPFCSSRLGAILSSLLPLSGTENGKMAPIMAAATGKWHRFYSPKWHRFFHRPEMDGAILSVRLSRR